MKRAFADLHLKVNPKDAQNLQHAINRAAKFGYKILSVPYTFEPSTEEVLNLKTVCKTAGVDPVLRIDLRPRNENDLMSNLRRYRRKFDVIGVVCENKEISRQAAKDRRVDLLNFPNLDYRKRFFDRPEAELARSGLAALEIDVKPLLVLEGPARIRFLSCLRREVAIAQNYGVPLVVSSGVGEERFMHMPRDMASLSYLFGLGTVEALDAVSVNPLAIVLRNREKLENSFVAPGIRLIKEGIDS
ncbi:MAG: RNase P subunit p30 family protein [Candidatus Bathyarchaeia archaeon]|jgi:RNase P/RNase MRP subunit p30